ncbi:MAG: ester cyclase family protein [Chloroflexota bacterium]|nr:ester cyclase family protein [Chloroflexota bacterium]
MATHVTAELVGKAYEALASGNRAEIEKYWDTDMKWLVPGHNPLSGWHYGLDGFLGFMGQVGAMSAHSFNMNAITVLVNDEWSVDVTHNTGYRAGSEGTGTVPYTKLDIDVAHLLRWRNGKIIEGRAGIFGDGTNEYDLFWAPVASHTGERLNDGTGGGSLKDVVRRLVEEVWNHNAQDRIPEFYGKNYIFFQEGGGAQLGQGSVKEWLDTTHTAFPDIKYRIDAVYMEGEKAAMRYHVTGTHTGDFRGLPASGKAINLSGHMMFRILDQKIIQAHGYWDMLGLMQQLGILPPFGGPPPAAPQK